MRIKQVTNLPECPGNSNAVMDRKINPFGFLRWFVLPERSQSLIEKTGTSEET